MAEAEKVSVEMDKEREDCVQLLQEFQKMELEKESHEIAKQRIGPEAEDASMPALDGKSEAIAREQNPCQNVLPDSMQPERSPKSSIQTDATHNNINRTGFLAASNQHLETEARALGEEGLDGTGQPTVKMTVLQQESGSLEELDSLPTFSRTASNASSKSMDHQSL